LSGKKDVYGRALFILTMGSCFFLFFNSKVWSWPFESLHRKNQQLRT